MRVFVTGGTGFIGSAVVSELIGAGHSIVGLARSEKAKRELEEAGASALDGSLEDIGSLRRGANESDASIHIAFIHNFAEFVASAEIDKRAIEAIGEALVGTNKPFVVTSGVPTRQGGIAATENDDSDPNYSRFSEQAAIPFAERGVRVSLVRPARFVHDGSGYGGFIIRLIEFARDKGVAAYVGNGENRIHAVHRMDLPSLYRLALEKGASGAKYQAVGDYAIPYREVAEAIGKRLGVEAVSIPPEKAAEHFGFLGQIVSSDNPASSDITQAALGWKPSCPSLLEDLASGYQELLSPKNGNSK